MRSVRFAWLACVLLALPACGDSGGGGGDDDPNDPDADGTTGPDAEVPEGFVELIGREWTIPPGEQYKCVGIRADQDYWISAFHTPNPTGEHHTVLTVDDNPGTLGTQLGEYDCEVNTLGLKMYFASGVGTDDLHMPEGVALKVEEGQFIHLNLHLFNTQPTESITARSSVFVKPVDPVEPDKEAEMVFAGNMDFTIPANSTGTVVTGGCEFNEPATIFAYWPHMHQYAVHQKVTMTVDGVETVIHDEPFDFEEQINYPLSPAIQIDGNTNGADGIEVQCTFDNPTDQPIRFGDSSTAEMCFTGLYRYPKQAFTLFDCSTGAGGGF